MADVLVNLNDVEDTRSVLQALYNYFTMHDMMEAQIHMETPQPSYLTLEIQRLRSRFDGYLSEALLQAYEEREDDESDSDDEIDLEGYHTFQDIEEAEEGSESQEEASEEPEAEPLPDFPLGKGPARTKGRRIKED